MIMPEDPTPQQAAYIARRLALMYKREYAESLARGINRLPKISATDLKPGDALVIAGIPGANDNSRYAAINVIAGVEPIFQSASPRQMESFGDWGTALGGGGMDTGVSPQ